MVWTNWRLPKGCWLHSIFSQKIHFVSPFPLAGTPTARMPFSSVILSGILFIRNPDWLERRNFKIVPRSIQLEASCSEQHNLPRPCSRSKFDFFKRSVFFFSFFLFLFCFCFSTSHHFTDQNLASLNLASNFTVTNTYCCFSYKHSWLGRKERERVR